MKTHSSTFLLPDTRVRVTDDGALVIGDTGSDLHLWTLSHRGESANADLWRRIAAAALDCAQMCDDRAAVAEVSA